MNTPNRLRKSIARMAPALLVAAGLHAAQTDIATEPLNTYSAPSSTDVKPNVLFVLDDSGSMDWLYMPDHVSGYSATSYYYKNNALNGVAYNPGVRYRPPVYYNADGTQNTTTYPNMDGTSAAKGANMASATPNWKAVPRDGYGVQDALTTTSDLTTSNAYVSVAGEYCTTPALLSCTTATAATGSYKYPAIVRWCSDAGLTTCRATYDSSTYNNLRMPAPRTATITVTAAASAVISGITVDGKQIMTSSSSSSSTTTTVASNIAARINSCTDSVSGNCTVAGYSASTSGTHVVTITGPIGSTVAPVITMGSGSMTSTTTNFVQGSVPGENIRHTITSGINSYAYPGTSAKHANRTDCAGTTCTYVEEMTNYANFYAYYRTRMQMMKSAASVAFGGIDTAADIAANASRFRVGYLSLNNNTGNDFLNLDEFKTSQKNAWFNKLFAANPTSGTPLREALSKAGRLYGGQLNGTTLNGSTVTDPLQYSCQQNYTILSTDGYWNGNGGKKLDGSTDMDNQDTPLPAPYNDGGVTNLQESTSGLLSEAGTLRGTVRRVLMKCNDTTANCGSAPANGVPGVGTGTATWTVVTSCTNGSGTSAPRCSRIAPSPTLVRNVDANCNTSASISSSSPYTSSNTDGGYQYNSCSYSWSTPASVSSCTSVAASGSSPYTVLNATRCSYTSWAGWTTVESCVATSQSASSPYTAGTARQCRTATSGGTSNMLADVAAYYYGKDLRQTTAENTASAAADRTGTCTGPTIPPATTANDLCANNVPPNGTDVATTQHMTTFTLGLGAQGRMVYSSSYASDTSGDYYDIKVGTTASPSTGICSWQNASETCTWPVPSSDSIANIDDLWHTAVNGRGTYYSAKDPESLATGLSNTLSAISNTPRAGTAAAAASSNPNVSSSDNYVFSSYYRSVEWWGEIVRRQLDSNGNLTPEQWSAMTLLDCGATPWQASKGYKAGQAFRNGTTCYKVTADYVSGTSFGSADTSNATVVYGAQDWIGSSRYAQGSVFRRAGDCYLVGADYTSDTTFGATDTTNAAVTATDSRCSTVTPQTTRTLYTKGTTAASLMTFDWTNLVAAGLDSYFKAPTLTYSSSTSGLSQFCTAGDCLSSSQQSNTTVDTGGAAGEALVNFLRGDRTYEGSYFRERLHVLGDIVASEGRHVKTPLFSYYDDNYSAFKTAMASRVGTVYVSANDGMLHAFDAETGQERWAYIPRAVLPTLYKLADKNYSTKHQFYVDASPETGDICPTAPSTTCTASQWKTILVGGLNRGGKGYFALDITNPSSPALLWEIDNTTTGFANLGYSYGNPRITKLHDGTWVVIFTSGYNNADGNGYLYVVNANSGALIRAIATGAGSATTPSGLSRIAAHSTTATTDNTVAAVYGGDLLGNLWRFDVNDQIGTSGYEAHRLVALVDAGGTAQPITEKPLVATIDGKTVVFVGTGRYLGTSDVTSTQTQSFYAIKDNSDAVTWGNPRTLANGFVSQTLTSGTCPSGAPSSVCSPGQSVRLTTDNQVDWNINSGWYFDLIGSGERSTTDPALVQGTLLFTTIAPSATSANACSSDSTDSSASFVYAVNYKTGGMLAGTQRVAGRSLGNVLATRPVVVKLADGSIRALIRTSGGSAAGDVVMQPTVQSLVTSTRRVSWRELVSDQ